MAHWLRAYLLLAVAVAILWGLNDQRKERSAQERQAVVDQAVLAHAEQLLASRLAGAATDLRFLAATDDLADLARQRSGAALDHAASLFVSLMEQKADYDQLRLLDANGTELLRLARHNHQPQRLPADRLENKAGRDYFENARIGRRGTVFVSRFDLNVEHGQVDLPHRPMLRLSTPLRVGDAPALVLVLNFDGQGLLDTLEETLRLPDTQGMLVDDEGFWLYHPDPQLRWGFMLPGATGMATRYPHSWAQMRGLSGDLDNDEGHFVYQPVRPFSRMQNVSGQVVDRGWQLALFRPPPPVTSALAPYTQLPFWLLQALLLAGVLVWHYQRRSDLARREQNRLDREQQRSADAQRLRVREQLYQLTLSVQRGRDPESFARILLSELAPLLGLVQGVVYRLDQGWLRPLSGYGLAGAVQLREFAPGDSLVAEALRERRQIRLQPAPQRYLPLVSGLGQSPPTQLLIVPLWVRDENLGAIELGLLRPLDQAGTELLSGAIPLLALHLANYLRRAASA